MSRPRRQRFHIDRRAHQLAEAAIALGADANDLLDTQAVADWLGVSISFLVNGRRLARGPPFIRISPRRVVYRRGVVIAWLESRTFESTKDYTP